jgi:hypothetical protein
MNFGTPPAELVWFVSPRSESYDCLLYRAMTTELWVAAAFSHTPGRLEDRREEWERACNGLGISTD